MTVRESTGWDRVFWEQSEAWPRGDREHIFLAAAIEEVGSAMFGPKWTGNEPVEGVDFDPVDLEFVRHDPEKALFGAKVALQPKGARPSKRPGRSNSSGLPNLKRVSPDANGFFYHKPDWHVLAWRREEQCRELLTNIDKAFESFGRLVDVCEWIAARGRDGDLATVGRNKAGGDFFPLPRSSWNTEQIWERRVRDCTLKHVHGSPPRLIDAYIFLTRQSLGRSLASLPFAPAATEAPASAAPEAVGEEIKHAAPVPPKAAEAVGSESRRSGRKRGRKTNPVWASSYARAYKQFRELAIGLSNEQFRDWVVKMNPTLGAQASPAHHRSIKSYRERAEAGEFEHFLGR